MKRELYLINDRLDIPDDIKGMSKEELDKEIARLEVKILQKNLEEKKQYDNVNSKKHVI